jgi:hypothetical protein
MTANDSKDLGADVDPVGPCAAYEMTANDSKGDLRSGQVAWSGDHATTADPRGARCASWIERKRPVSNSSCFAADSTEELGALEMRRC